MATRIQVLKAAKNSKELLEKIVSYDLEELIRKDELGTTLSFKEYEEEIIGIIELFKKVNEIDLNRIPYHLTSNFYKDLNKAAQLFLSLKEFDPQSPNSSRFRIDLIKQLDGAFDTYNAAALPILQANLVNSNDLSIEKAKVKQLLAELKEQKEESKLIADEKLNELNNVLENAKSFATEEGVSKHENIFNEESLFHKGEAKKWLDYTRNILIAIGVVAILFGIIGICFNETNQIVQLTISKVIILSALFYGLSITNKNLKAHKHNEILNKHRQNALKTFETFANSSSADAQTKNAVLLETTHSIFSNQQSGYLKNDSDGDSNNKIVEIIKNISTKGE